jgi:hypothetical protein
METKKESKGKAKPTPEETKEFWRDWRKGYRLTSGGKSLDELRKRPKKAKGGREIFRYFVSILKWLIVVFLEFVVLTNISIFDIDYKMETKKELKSKNRPTPEETEES